MPTSITPFVAIAAGLGLAAIPVLFPVSPALIPPATIGLALPPAVINAALVLPGLLLVLLGLWRAAPAAPNAYSAATTRVLFLVTATLVLILVALIILVAVTATPALAISLGEMAEEAGQDLEVVPFFISVAFYILGVLIVGFGLIRLKRHVDQPSQTTMGSGIVALIVGVALLAAPSVINAIGETFGVDATATISRPALD